MKRIVEPELMTGAAQARAYAAADFSAAHDAYVSLFAGKFPQSPKQALVLDLGCGPCDVTLRFSRANPGFRFHAVDGSAAMLEYGRRAMARHPGLARRIRLIEGFIPGAPLPNRRYDIIFSSSFLHHLHDPRVLWQTVRRYSRPGTLILVADLRRPASRAKARAFVRQYSGDEPAVLQRDFFNSLLAAFTPAEIRRQLRVAALEELKVEVISDRHVLISGQITAD